VPVPVDVLVMVIVVDVVFERRRPLRIEQMPVIAPLVRMAVHVPAVPVEKRRRRVNHRAHRNRRVGARSRAQVA
jgi:hypothetical protein